MDLNVVQQVPNYIYFYERYLTINETLSKTLKDFIHQLINHQSGLAYLKNVADLRKSLKNGLDVKTADDDHVTDLESCYGIEYKEPEKQLYKDNCGPDEETGICPYRRLCRGTDKEWLEKAREQQRKMDKQEHLAKTRMEMYAKTREELDKFHEESNTSVVSEEDVTSSEMKHDDRDESYTPGSPRN